MARRASVMGGDTVLTAAARDVTAEQKEANEITSLRSEFQRMVLAKINWNIVLLFGGHLPVFVMAAVLSVWVDAHSAGGHYWFVPFFAALALFAQRSPWVPRWVGGEVKRVRLVYIADRDDLDKSAMLCSWALTAALAAVLVIGGVLQLQQVSRCEGPYTGAMLNPTKMRLFNLTLEKIVDSNAVACTLFGEACNVTQSRCPHLGTWETAYVCDFCADETHFCDVRRRGIPACEPCIGKDAPCAKTCNYCFPHAPVKFNEALGYLAVTVGASTVLLAALRFAKNWSLRVIVYDLEAIATSDYPPPPPVPAKSLAGLLQEERDKVHVEKPKKQKKNAAGKHNQVGPGDVAIAPPSNPITL